MTSILDFIRHPFEVGALRISILSLFIGLILLIVLGWVSRLLRRSLRDKILPRAGVTPAAASSVSTLAGYAFIFIGLLTIVPVMLPGFDFATLSLMAGALSLGLGFGLRNIADNFVSGLILLIEQPIKVGDRIQVGPLEGAVLHVRARSTTVRTNDNIDIIVPNSEFVSSRVTNMSHNDNTVRFRVPIGVHYKSDVREVEAALLAAAGACADVLKHPEPQVRFMGFGGFLAGFRTAGLERIALRPAEQTPQPGELRNLGAVQVAGHCRALSAARSLREGVSRPAGCD